MQEVPGIYCGPCKRDLFSEPEVWQHSRAHAEPLAFTEADGPFLGWPRERVALPAITTNDVLDAFESLEALTTLPFLAVVS